MKFYSYSYITSRVALTDWIQLGLAVLLSFCIGLALWFYYHNHKDTKYRELAIISVICFLILGGIRVNDLQNREVASTRYGAAAHLMEAVAQDLAIEPDLLYINTEAAADGAIIKENDHYYRTIVDASGQYLLEPLSLHNPKIELIEVNP